MVNWRRFQTDSHFFRVPDKQPMSNVSFLPRTVLPNQTDNGPLIPGYKSSGVGRKGVKTTSGNDLRLLPVFDGCKS